MRASTRAQKPLTIASPRGNDTCWVSNSLLDALTNAQMVGMARSVAELRPTGQAEAGEWAIAWVR